MGHLGVLSGDCADYEYPSIKAKYLPTHKMQNKTTCRFLPRLTYTPIQTLCIHQHRFTLDQTKQPIR